MRFHDARRAEWMGSAIDHGLESRRALERLDGIVAAMADAVTPFLESMTPERYRDILSVCYHYTRASGAQLERAAELAPDEELRAFFVAMADEERDHFRLAEADLAAMGGVVRESPIESVVRFADYWNGIAGSRAFEFLGATYVLENLAGRLREAALSTLAVLGLGRRQCRFVATHLEADAEHGLVVAELCARHAHDQGPAMIAGGEAALWYWREGAQSLFAARAR